MLPHPLDYRTPPCAWQGGFHRPPTWVRVRFNGALDAAGVHLLLRASGLPRAELLHMGAPAWLLDPGCLPYVPEEIVLPLLGRIVWDATFGEEGCVWTECSVDRHAAVHHGRVVIKRWFVTC